MRQRQLEADEHGGAEGSQLERALPLRDHRDDAGERKHGELEDELQRPQARDPAGVVLAPVPGRERRVAVELVADRAVDEDVHGMGEARLEEQDRERGHRRDDEGQANLSTARGRRPFG